MLFDKSNQHLDHDGVLVGGSAHCYGTCWLALLSLQNLQAWEDMIFLSFLVSPPSLVTRISGLSKFCTTNSIQRKYIPNISLSANFLVCAIFGSQL